MLYLNLIMCYPIRSMVSEPIVLLQLYYWQPYTIGQKLWTIVWAPTACVLIDFAKAFDSVPHGHLLLKLQALGVHGSLLQWFRSFLTTRRQRVVVNWHFSDWSAVSSGVPQGSILGPLLFIIYVNDISSAVRSNIQMFADDLTLYRVVSSLRTVNSFKRIWTLC